MNERNKYLALNDWFLAPQGKHVARAFASEIQPLSAELSGKSLLQFGACGESPWLESLNYQNKWFVSAIYLFARLFMPYRLSAHRWIASLLL